MGNGPCGWVTSGCRCHSRGRCVTASADAPGDRAYAFIRTTLTATTMATTGATGGGAAGATASRYSALLYPICSWYDSSGDVEADRTSS